MSKRIVLIGSRDIGKSSVIESLDKAIRDYVPEPTPDVSDYAVGELADYRMEMYIAAGRVFFHLRTLPMPMVLSHSLIDSVAYGATRLYNIINAGITDQDEIIRWQVALDASSRLLIDSYSADHTIFIEGNDGTEFGKTLEEALRETVIQFGIEYTTLQSSEEAAKLIETLLSEDDGQSTAIEDPDAGQDS